MIQLHKFLTKGYSSLLILTIGSFLPQYNLILSRHDCTGISGLYVLLNLVVATEQFAVYLHFVIAYNNGKFIGRSPGSTHDYLNLAQTGTVFLCQFILFILYLYFPPFSFWKSGFICLYVVYALISFGLVGLEYTESRNPKSRYGKENGLLPAFISYLHLIVLIPLSSFLAMLALIPQAFEIQWNINPQAMSITGLWIQAIVFAILAWSWNLRFDMSNDIGIVSPNAWYKTVGWLTVNNSLYAIVQGTLWWMITTTKDVRTS